MTRTRSIRLRVVVPVCLLAISLAASGAFAAPGDPGCEFDFDGDGLVTEDDLWFCQSLLQVFPPIYNPLCDANGDGYLSAIDLVPIITAVQSGVDCRAVVPIGSPLSRGLLLGALTLASVLAIRFGVAQGR